MYISTQKLASVLLEQSSHPDELLSLLSLAKKLISRFGKKVFQKNFSDMIEDIDWDIVAMLSILAHTSKKSAKDIADLISLVKQQAWTYTHMLTIQSTWRHWWELTKKLEQRMSERTIKTEIDDSYNDIWVRIAWEGRYFERNLEKDIDKLLRIK